MLAQPGHGKRIARRNDLDLGRSVAGQAAPGGPFKRLAQGQVSPKSRALDLSVCAARPRAALSFEATASCIWRNCKGDFLQEAVNEFGKRLATLLLG